MPESGGNGPRPDGRLNAGPAPVKESGARATAARRRNRYGSGSGSGSRLYPSPVMAL